ncbi:unnamed protein product, partial [Iphiclides podalirius]
MTYDTTTGKATMSSELTESSTFEYNLENPNSILPAVFSLQIEPRMVNKRHLINLHFEADNAGPLTLEPCEVKDFENIQRIVLKGADSINSLFFKFKT